MFTLTRPSESEVRSAQDSLGLDYLQAYRHCQARDVVRQKIQREHDEAYARCLRESIESQRRALGQK